MSGDRIENTQRISDQLGIQQRYSYPRPKPGASFGYQVAVSADLFDIRR